MDKLLTISIAAYNMESYVEKAIESCTADANIREKIEIIIVNDGSFDKTLEIARGYEAKYPECIKVIDKENGGYGSTINSSILQATGKFYRLLDADDWYDKKGLELLLDFLDKCDTDLVFSDYNTVTDSGEFIEKMAYRFTVGEKYVFEGAQFLNDEFAMHGVSVRTDLLKNANIQISEHCFFTDTEFVYNCYKVSNTFSYIDADVYQYRMGRNGQSISREGMIKHADDAIKVAKKLYNDCPKEGVLAQIAKRAVFFAYNSLLLSGKDRFVEILDIEKDIKAKNESLYYQMESLKSLKLMRKVNYHFKSFWIANAKRKVH